jgi:hypothetical protein
LSGRPRVEPRVRKLARRYDRRAVKELFRIGTDPKAPHDVRRRALGDLVAIGSGRPALVQEIAGRGGEPLSPLVQLNFPQPGVVLTAEQAYAAMIHGTIPLDPDHVAFRRPPIEAEAVSGGAGAEYSAGGASAPASKESSAGSQVPAAPAAPELPSSANQQPGEPPPAAPQEPAGVCGRAHQ